MDLEALASDAVDHVNSLCRPDVMDKSAAKEFLEIVVSRLEASIEALDDELQNQIEDETEPDR